MESKNKQPIQQQTNQFNQQKLEMGRYENVNYEGLPHSTVYRIIREFCC